MKRKLNPDLKLLLEILVIIGGGVGAIWLLLWLAITPPWHLIEKTYATGVVCTTQQKVGEETTRTGKSVTTKPIGAGPATYKAISVLPSGATKAQERDVYNNMLYHCNGIARSPQHFPSVVEIQPVYSNPKDWIQTGYISVEFN